VAVKKFRKASLPKAQLKQAKGELELLMEFNHPNILGIYGHFEDNQYFYIILEYCDKGSVADLLQEYKSLPHDIVRAILVGVLDGLKYLHGKGIVHRDLKAANLLITGEGEIKLADFGVSAKVIDPDGGNQSRFSVVGTPYWMAPEIIEMVGHGTSSDIWSLGCVVIELLTGTPPYWELNQAAALLSIVENNRPPFPKNISIEFEDFLSKCFVKDPENRATVEQLQDHPLLKDVNKNFNFVELKKRLDERKMVEKLDEGKEVKLDEPKEVKLIEGKEVKLDEPKEVKLDEPKDVKLIELEDEDINNIENENENKEKNKNKKSERARLLPREEEECCQCTIL